MNSVGIISSISYSQHEILDSIIKLHVPRGTIDCDPCFGSGRFYQRIPEPEYKYDLYPRREDVIKCSCDKLPLADESIESIIYDPPFTCGSTNKGRQGVIKKSFSAYKNMDDLWKHYYDSMAEFYRCLKYKGVLIVKCQDTVSGGKNYFSHVAIMNFALGLGFYPLDLFVLMAKSRLIGNNMGNQQHARKYHSYFLVLKKDKLSIDYRHDRHRDSDREVVVSIIPNGVV